jgi:hypothetical protein
MLRSALVSGFVRGVALLGGLSRYNYGVFCGLTL